VWEAVETNTGKVGVRKTEGGESKGESRRKRIGRRSRRKEKLWR